MDPFIGQIIFFAGNFAPKGWALCDGQLLSVAENTALFSILGTTYGGDGRTTFALPDLRGRVAVHAGTGPGLTPCPLGKRGGAENMTLQLNHLPRHSHALAASNSAPDEDLPAGNVLGKAEIYASGSASQALGTSSVGTTGEGQPFDLGQPSLCINAIIALQGVYPSRS